MITLDREATELLDFYLARVRAECAGRSDLDVEEVVLDVREHVERAFESASAPIDADRLREILDGLGSPERWLAAPERAAPQGSTLAWRSRPLGERLAWVSGALFYSGLVLCPAAIFLWPVAYLLARSSLARTRESPLPRAVERWLLFPPLVAGDAIFALALLLWPALALARGSYAVLELEDLRPRFPARVVELARSITEIGELKHDALDAMTAAFGVAPWFLAACGVWWIALGILLSVRSAWLRSVLRPFADRIGGRPFRALAWGGAALVLIAAMVAVARAA